MADIWRPEIEDVIEAHDQAGNISKIRTPGFMHSRETVKKQPFSDGNHRTGIIIAKETLNENDEEFKVSKIKTGEEIRDDMKWNLKTSTLQEIAEWIKTGKF